VLTNFRAIKMAYAIFNIFERGEIMLIKVISLAFDSIDSNSFSLSREAPQWCGKVFFRLFDQKHFQRMTKFKIITMTAESKSKLSSN
jgi:hypothetical protein